MVAGAGGNALWHGIAAVVPEAQSVISFCGTMGCGGEFKIGLWRQGAWQGMARAAGASFCKAHRIEIAGSRFRVWADVANFPFMLH